MARTKTILDVDLIPQHGSRLCWAASIQMVLKYLRDADTTGQGNLSDSLDSILIRGIRGSSKSMTPTLINECNSFQQNCIPGSFLNDTNLKIWNFDLPNEPQKQLFDMLLSEQGFYSSEDPEGLTWSWVTNQIQTCRRPFIMVIYQADDLGRPVREITHAVVVRGIWKDSNGVNYLYVNDPLADSPCTGESYSLHFVNLMSGTNSLRTKVFVVNIMQKDNKVLKFTRARGAYLDTTTTYGTLGAIESELLVL